MRRRIAVAVVLTLTALLAFVAWRIDAARMPGEAFEGPSPPATEEDRRLSARLAADVRTLAIEIGERNERRYGALVEPIRSEGAVVSRSMLGATWSDHASFWRHDVPAILVTDTAAFRDPHYHRASDDGSQIDLIALARVTLGLERVLRGP